MLAAASFSGCFVSFDGYELAGAGGSDDSGSGGTLSGGGASGSSGASGKSSAGASSGGAAGGAGTNTGATSGEAGADTGGGPVNGGAGNGGAGTTNGGATNGGATNGGAVSGGATNGGAVSGGATNGGTGATNGGAGSGGASAGAAGSGNPVSCPPPVHGAILVEIPKPSGGIFCIDRTEVTNADYAQFLATNPSTATQSSVCNSNATFAPAVDPTNCTQYDPTGNGKAPVSCVSWCDAQAFCAWAGKRLCGKIGGGSNLTSDFADASKSEWYTACSHDGAYDFPYGADGPSYEPKSCIGADYGGTRQSSVPTASCQGGYNGVFDMSGNVSEWEDSCAASTGATDQCAYRGGSYNNLDTSVPSLQCNSGIGATAKLATKARSTRDPEIGFRCCADP